MPILNNQVKLTGVDNKGNRFQLEPKVALLKLGPRVDVLLSLPEDLIEIYQKESREIPQPVAGHALIDTGASSTSIDESTVQSLGLFPVGEGIISSASHEQSAAKKYNLNIFISQSNLTLNAYGAFGLPLRKQGIVALIGRDLLQNCIFLYNGPIGAYILTY